MDYLERPRGRATRRRLDPCWEGRRGCCAQDDQNVANAAGATVRSDLNANLQALVTNSSGAAAPSTTWAYQWWADTTTGLLKIRNAANSAWVTVGTLATANLGLLVATMATQAEQETGTSIVTAVSPGRQHYHPSAAKAWARFTTVTTTAIKSSYNVTSLTDNGTGDTTITFTTAFSGATYNGIFSGRQDSANINLVIVPDANFAAGSCRVLTYNNDPTLQLRDYEFVGATFFGDQ